MTKYQKYKDAIKQTNKARRVAIRRLIELHREEFDQLYVEEANKHGLNPTKTQNKLEKADNE